MKSVTLPGFRRCLHGLSDNRLEAVRATIRAAEDAYGHLHRHAGIGLRALGDYMECRDALEMRLVFQRNGDALEFHFYGTHDEVKAFLRNRR
ncbi:MAG TPA: hypothetical protein VGM73_05775 [Candidatus Didemnitutus sp.]|jgi:hypothetical protein